MNKRYSAKGGVGVSELRNPVFQQRYPHTLMKNKIIHIISAFLLASMVVPIVVEGVELARDHTPAESSPFTRKVSERDLLYLDAAAAKAYEYPQGVMRVTAPLPQQELP